MDYIEIFKQKRTLESLSKMTGINNSTSLISLLLPPDTQLPKIVAMLTAELGTASSIKSRVTRQNVEEALRTIIGKLKLTKLPANGLVVYAGRVQLDKDKKVCILIEPIKQLKQMIYRCDHTFVTEPLFQQLSIDNVYGYIVIDGKGVLLAKVQGDQITVLTRYPVELPNKHRRGGQSSGRFARHRELVRLAYLHKISELASFNFIDPQTTLPNVKGIMVGGSADLKDLFVDHKHLDQRLQSIVLGIVDINYGDMAGLYETISLSDGQIQNCKIIETRKILSEFFTQISKDGPVTFGHKHVIYALEVGAVDTLLIDTDLRLWRCIYQSDNTEKIEYTFDPEALKENKIQQELFLDWTLQNYKEMGIKVELVSGTSDLGMQFCKGFGGLGALLRYQITMNDVENDVDDEQDENEMDIDLAFV